MNRAQTWVVGKMTAWHEGPYGGRCPRTDGPECSQYGIGAVRRYGAVCGVLVVARYVAACRASGPEDPPFGCRFAKPDPNRWAFQLALVPLVGLHLREALPKPQPGSCPFLMMLFLFAQIGLFGQAPPGRNCERNRRESW